jgi:DNA-binding HxlR family transcriptional regulator
MDELIENPRAFRVLCALALKDTPMNFREFTEASQTQRAYSAPLRELLADLGYIEVVHHTEHANAGVMEIRLTPFGRGAAKLLLELDEFVKKERAGGNKAR